MLAVLVLFGLVILFASLLFWIAPFAQGPRFWNLAPEEAAAVTGAQLQARAIIIQVIGGVFLAGTLAFTIWNLRLAQEDLRISQEGQITERFTRAIDHLASDNLMTRLGGIYALERIARDSDRDHWPVMEILTAYVREQAPASKTEEEEEGEPDQVLILGRAWYQPVESRVPPVDIQAAITVIGRREPVKFQFELGRIDLHSTDLRGADLQHAFLQKANLTKADLRSADLREAQLHEALLDQADLRGVRLENALLQKANLGTADLRSATLTGAQLQQALLAGALLQGASLRKAQLQQALIPEADLRGANLEGANLDGAYFEGTDLDGVNIQGASLAETDFVDAMFGSVKLAGANLDGSNLEGMDLRRARGLTQDQINKSHMDEGTRLPDEPGPDGQPYRRSTRVRTWRSPYDPEQ
jgi:uncharacterized protein YjbI with pentapeptide repeats